MRVSRHSPIFSALSTYGRGSVSFPLLALAQIAFWLSGWPTLPSIMSGVAMIAGLLVFGGSIALGAGMLAFFDGRAGFARISFAKFVASRLLSASLCAGVFAFFGELVSGGGLGSSFVTSQAVMGVVMSLPPVLLIAHKDGPRALPIFALVAGASIWATAAWIAQYTTMRSDTDGIVLMAMPFALTFLALVCLISAFLVPAEVTESR